MVQPAAKRLVTEKTAPVVIGKVTRPAYLTRNNDFRQIPVVMFHQFTSESLALGTLKDYFAWGYEPIFYSEMMEWLRTGDATNLPAKPVVFTDDDGGATVYTNLFPAMKELGAKMTCFIVPDWIDGTISQPVNGGVFGEPTAMTWAQAREMQASGLTEFQSHTKNHGSMRALTGVGTHTAGLTEDGSGAGPDYLYCKNRIETMIPGSKVEYNAAPYGVINQRAINSLRAAGCRGNRITETGKNMAGDFDGSGPTAFVTLGVDPFEVPIADGGSFGHIRRANVYGIADVDGNMVENGKFSQTARGWTVPAGWNYIDDQELPRFAKKPRGRIMRGLSTTLNGQSLIHTKAIPVGFYNQFTVEFYVKSIQSPPGSIKLYLDTFVNPTDVTPVSSLLMPGPEGGVFDWKPRRWYVVGSDAYQWVKPRFVVENPTADTHVQLWDVSLRRQRTEWGA